MATIGIMHRAHGAEEQKDDQHDDEQGIGKGFQNFADGIIDVFGGIIGKARLHAAGQILHYERHLFTHALDHIDAYWRWAGW